MRMALFPSFFEGEIAFFLDIFVTPSTAFSYVMRMFGFADLHGGWFAFLQYKKSPFIYFREFSFDESLF